MKIYAYLVLGLVWVTLVQIGLILGLRKRVVIFGDKLDFLFSAMLPAFALTLWVAERGGVQVALVVLSLVVLGAVIWRAQVENRRIWKTGLAAVTKLSLVLTLTYLALSVPYFLPRAFDRSADGFGRFSDAYLGVMGAAMLGVVGGYVFRHAIKASHTPVAISDNEAQGQEGNL
jgi:hypothetical protein